MKDKRYHLWILLAAGFLGLLGYFFCYDDVFPSASIDLKLPAYQIKQASRDWASRMHYNTSGTIESTVFSFDDNAKTFLEYELGLAQANRLMKTDIPVWYWSTRHCRPLQQEEFSTAISPTGQLISFEHGIENDVRRPSISHDAARQLATDFIEKQAGQSLTGYRSVEDGAVSQPHRSDQYFTWEDTTSEFRGARLRTYVYISGNEITAYNHFLYIPELWVRKFSQLRSYNKALEDVASIFYLIFTAATFFAFVWAFTTGLLRWRFSLLIALLVGGMDFLESVNSLPSTIHAYNTSMSFNGYLIDTYVSAGRSALTQFLQTLLVAGAAEALYRLAYPGKIALERLFTNAGLRTKQVLTGLVAGHGMFGVHLGWIIAYYLFGRNIGFWSPLEVRNVEGLSSTLPFFSAMNIGVSAAIFEEFTYRVLGMTLISKLVRNFWLANLLQAVAWAFMHSNYPQEPPYARGLELTAVGLFYGFMLKRFGLLSCVLSHCVFDSFLGVTPLLTSPAWSAKFTAVVAIAPFFIVMLFAWYLQKRDGVNQEEDKLANAAVPQGTIAPPIEEIFPQTPYEYPSLSRVWRIVLVAFITLSAAIQFGYFFPVVGQGAPLMVSHDRAVEIARRYLLQNGVEPAGRFEAAFLVKGVNLQELQYIFEKTGYKKTQELALLPGHPLVWQVRFFRLLDPLEYLVTIDANGRPLSLSVSMSEEAPGAKIKQAAAQQKAENYLKREHREVLPYEFQDASVQVRKARTDYNFRFNIPKFKVLEADFKVIVSMAGDMISGYDQEWELPDKWLFEQKRVTVKDHVCSYLIAFLELVMFLAAVWWTIGVARSGAIKWRPAIILSGLVALLVIPQALNDLPEFFVGYGTDTPLLSYLTAQGARQILTAVSSIAIVLALSAFALASFRLLSPRAPLSSIAKGLLVGDTVHSADTRWNLWLDAVLVGFAGGLGNRALITMISALHAYFSPVVSMIQLDNFCALANVLSPSLDSSMDAFTHGLQFTLVSAILAGVYAKYFTRFRFYVVFAIIFSLLYPSTDRYWQDYALSASSDLLFFFLTWIFVAKLARLNLMAYFLAGASNLVAGTIRLLIGQGLVLYSNDIVFLSLFLISPIIYLFFLRYGTRLPQQVPPAADAEQSSDSDPPD